MSKQNISLTADSVIFCRTNDTLEVLLVKRKYDPYKDAWALPGGFLKDEEPLEQGAQRELEEETGIKAGQLEQIRAYGRPDRDPRGRTVSVGFWGLLSYKEEPKGQDDAAQARWFDVNDLPDLAFDHDVILKEALDRLTGQSN